MYGLFGALYLLIAGTADHVGSKRKGRESAARLQKSFDEQEKIRRQHEERVNAILERYAREDAERAEREAAGK